MANNDNNMAAHPENKQRAMNRRIIINNEISWLTIINYDDDYQLC